MKAMPSVPKDTVLCVYQSDYKVRLLITLSIYDLNTEKLIRGNLREFDIHLGILVDVYSSQLMLPEECNPADI